MYRIVVVMIAAGCASETRTPVHVRPAPPVTSTPWAVAEPAPRTPDKQTATDGPYEIDLRWISEQVERERKAVVIDRSLGRASGIETDLLDRDFWEACVRDVVLQEPESLRRTLAALVNTYTTSCDGEGRVLLERPLDIDGRERRGGSNASLVGRFGAGQIDLVLRIDYCGGDEVDHVAVIGRDASWTSQRVEFQRSATCMRADIPVTRTVARAVHALAEGQASLRVEGPRGYDVIAIDEEAQRVLRIALDARDARETLDSIR